MEHAGVRFALRGSDRHGFGCRQPYITLSIREKNPKTLIHACVDSEGLRRLRLTGTDHVLSAYNMALSTNRSEDSCGRQ